MSDTILNRSESIRLYCLDCTGGSYADVRNCSITDCALHPLRMGKTPAGMNKATIIRDYCRACIGNHPSKCDVRGCALHPFRTGIRSENSTIGTIFEGHSYVLDGRTCKGMAELRKRSGDSE